MHQPVTTYYLHANGKLIHKPHGGVEEEPGGFVRKVWTIDTRHRQTGWEMLIEAIALDASPDEVDRLARHWHMTDRDAQGLVDHVPGYRLRKEESYYVATLPSGYFGIDPHALQAWGAAKKHELAGDTRFKELLPR